MFQMTELWKEREVGFVMWLKGSFDLVVTELSGAQWLKKIRRWRFSGSDDDTLPLQVFCQRNKEKQVEDDQI